MIVLHKDIKITSTTYAIKIVFFILLQAMIVLHTDIKITSRTYAINIMIILNY